MLTTAICCHQVSITKTEILQGSVLGPLLFLFYIFYKLLSLLAPMVLKSILAIYLLEKRTLKIIA